MESPNFSLSINCVMTSFFVIFTCRDCSVTHTRTETDSDENTPFELLIVCQQIDQDQYTVSSSISLCSCGNRMYPETPTCTCDNVLSIG